MAAAVDRRTRCPTGWWRLVAALRLANPRPRPLRRFVAHTVIHSAGSTERVRPMPLSAGGNLRIAAFPSSY
jgi:hypothetical protein